MFQDPKDLKLFVVWGELGKKTPDTTISNQKTFLCVLFFCTKKPNASPFMSRFMSAAGCGPLDLQAVGGVAAGRTRWPWIPETTGVCGTSPSTTLAAEAQK